MSGVYIKGMEMPESCAECLNIGWQYVFECNLNDVESGARLGSCSLIPVPDHGRLVDADELKSRVRESVNDARNDFIRNKDWKLAVQVAEGFCLDIDETTTIIPADKEGEK